MGIRRLHRQTLLVDADDTLWENNIYFEQVIRSVQEMLVPWNVPPGVFREYLNEREREHIEIHGYGTVNFTRSLVAAFERFLDPAADPALSSRVRNMALAIMNHPVELLDGVAETVEYLHRRHDLHLVTKGSAEEQTRKIESSGLSAYFRRVEILPEKNHRVYAELLQRHAWSPDSTWMIGNSPRSDINPALEAGLHAIYIPHANTWVLEHEDPADSPRLLVLRSFRQLRDFF